MSISPQPQPESQLQSFDVPVLLVEARYGTRTLCTQVLSTRSPRGFTVGSARRADAPIDPRYLPAGQPANDNHTLVEPSGGGFVIHLSPAMRERAQRSATRLRIPCGEVVFDITAAAPPPAVPRTWLRRGWLEDARITGAVALGVVLLLLLVRAVPSDPHALSLDDVGKDLRMGVARVVPEALVPPPQPVKGERGPAGGAGAATAASGPAGTAGDHKAPKIDARRATKGPEHQDARAVEAWVRSNTMLALLDGERTRSIAALLDSNPALGDKTEEVLGHLEGREIASAWGLEGLSDHGTGAGGADTGKAMLGGGRGLKTIGKGGNADGPGRGYGDKAGILGPRPKPPIVFITTPPSVRGSLDKEIVRRVVRQHLNEVRYCYEQALVRQPSLAGRVVTMFTIGAKGDVIVSALASSTLGAPLAESCIVAAPKRWQFPAPEGGGLVTVSYPFQLAPAGG
jgi:hypothetical protein